MCSDFCPGSSSSVSAHQASIKHDARWLRFQAVNVTGGTAPMSAMNPMGTSAESHVAFLAPQKSTAAGWPSRSRPSQGMMGKGGFGPMIAGGRVFKRFQLHVSLQLLAASEDWLVVALHASDPPISRRASIS